MMQTIQEQYLPVVSLEELLAFDPEREETFTESRFVNTYLLNYHKRRTHSKDIARAMGVQEELVPMMFRAETGMSVNDFHYYITAVRIHRVLEQFESDKNEMKALLASTEESISQTLKDKGWLNSSATDAVLSDLSRSINRTDSVTIAVLAEKVGTFCRSRLAKFVNSKRYAEITRELGLRRYVSGRRHR